MTTWPTETTAISANGRRSTARRLGWGVADQAMSSLSNFLLGAYVAKTFGAGGLGAFALAFVTYSIILNASRGLSTDPLVVRFSGAPASTWRPAVAAATGVAIVVGLAAGAVSLSVGAGLTVAGAGGDLGGAFLALGIALPGLMLQDSWRYAFFSAGRGSAAFVNDAVWTALLVVGLVVAHVASASSVGVVLLIYGASAAVAALVGGLQARVLPRPRATITWLRNNVTLGPRYLAENLIQGVSSHFRSFVLAVATGLSAVGQLRAAEMLVGPFLVIFMGVAQVAVPEGRRWLSRGARLFKRFCLLISAGLASAALAYGAVVMWLLPLGMGDLLLGSVWESAYVLAPGVIASSMAGSFIVGASTGLRVLGRADRSLRAQILVTMVTVTGGGVGALLWDAPGAVWGGAFAAVVGATIWWFSLNRAMVDHFRADDLTVETADVPATSLRRP